MTDNDILRKFIEKHLTKINDRNRVSTLIKNLQKDPNLLKIYKNIEYSIKQNIFNFFIIQMSGM